MPDELRAATPTTTTMYPLPAAPRRPTARRALLVALAASGVLAACGPSGMTADDGGAQQDAAPSGDGARNCDNPCACAERGAPDFSREASGQLSPSSDDAQRAALTRANHWRTAAGLAPFAANAEIEQASTAHSTYLATTPQATCWANPHVEVATCTGFTGAQMINRMQSAGYSAQRASEVINWEATPEQAIDGWIWTVYHRQPFMDYRYTETGYGRVNGPFGSRSAFHNTMDFGARQGGPAAMPQAQPAVFPVPGQTNVPPAFRGDFEGPTPPAPASTGRWPSGTVVSVHFPNAMWTITAHRLFQSNPAAGTCTEVAHTFVSKDNDPNLNRGGSAANDVFLYGDTALSAGTEYVVQVEGTFNNAPYARTWAFTTQ